MDENTGPGAPAEFRRVVALLRGVNVGGHRKVRMAELRSALESRGALDVVTYLQSGNVAFDTNLPETTIAELVRTALAEDIGGGDVGVVVRDRSDIAEVVRHCPFPADETGALHVMFLGPGVDAEWFSPLEGGSHAPESAVLGDRHIWLHLPGGVGRSSLMADLPGLLRGSPAADALVTTRNWRTVQALADL